MKASSCLCLTIYWGRRQAQGLELRKADDGVMSVLEAGSKTGMGHEDQRLGYLSQAGLKPEERLVVGGENFTIQDMINQAQWNLHEGMEATWTLMVLSTYLPLDSKWTARDGSEWTIERIVEMEVCRISTTAPAAARTGCSALRWRSIVSAASRAS